MFWSLHALLSEASRKTFDKVFICAMLSQSKIKLNRIFVPYNLAFLFNVVLRVLRQHHVTGFFLEQCCLEPQGQHCTGFFLCNVVSGVSRQHCTVFFLGNVIWGVSLSQYCTDTGIFLYNVDPWLTDYFYEENNL